MQASVYLYTDGHNQAHYSKCTAMRPGLETISYQHAVHAQIINIYTQIMQSISQVHQNQVSRKKFLLVGDFYSPLDLLYLFGYKPSYFYTN